MTSSIIYVEFVLNRGVRKDPKGTKGTATLCVLSSSYKKGNGIACVRGKHRFKSYHPHQNSKRRGAFSASLSCRIASGDGVIWYCRFAGSAGQIGLRRPPRPAIVKGWFRHDNRGIQSCLLI